MDKEKAEKRANNAKNGVVEPPRHRRNRVDPNVKRFHEMLKSAGTSKRLLEKLRGTPD